MYSSSGYEVRVSLASLEEASKLMRLLAENGFKDVSMIQTAPVSERSHKEFARSSESLNRFNELILASLYRAGARTKANSVTIEQVMENLKEIHGGLEIIQEKGEGIVSRTVSMVASAVLGHKYGWVRYEDTEPRRYWLSESGLEHTGIISGEAGREEEVLEQKA